MKRWIVYLPICLCIVWEHWSDTPE